MNEGAGLKCLTITAAERQEARLTDGSRRRKQKLKEQIHLVLLASSPHLQAPKSQDIPPAPTSYAAAPFNSS